MGTFSYSLIFIKFSKNTSSTIQNIFCFRNFNRNVWCNRFVQSIDFDHFSDAIVINFKWIFGTVPRRSIVTVSSI